MCKEGLRCGSQSFHMDQDQTFDFDGSGTRIQPLKSSPFLFPKTGSDPGSKTDRIISFLHQLLCNNETRKVNEKILEFTSTAQINVPGKRCVVKGREFFVIFSLYKTNP